jgi:hypothetical protein
MSYTEELNSLAHEVIKSAVAKPALYARMRDLASRHRAPGQSVEQSFAKIFASGDPVGRAVMKRYSSLAGPGYFAQPEGNLPASW